MKSFPARPFLTLPAEIRLRIYRYLFIKDFDGREEFESSGDSTVLMPAPYVIKHHHDRNGGSKACKDQLHLRGWSRSSQFLQCCRTIALEARPVLYGENTFYVDSPSAISFFVREMIGSTASMWIQHITLSDSWTRQLDGKHSNRVRHVDEIQALPSLKTLRITMLLRPDLQYWPPGSDEHSCKALFDPRKKSTVIETQERLRGKFILALLTRLQNVKVFVDGCGPEVESWGKRRERVYCESIRRIYSSFTRMLMFHSLCRALFPNSSGEARGSWLRTCILDVPQREGIV